MRKLLTIVLLAITNITMAQLSPGLYSYKNEDSSARITFTITEDGYLKDCQLKSIKESSVLLLKGYRSIGVGEFTNSLIDVNKPTPYVGEYIVSGDRMNRYSIKVKATPSVINVVIDVRMPHLFTRE